MSGCIVCGEEITNPVCMECTEREIKEWLFEVEPELAKKIEGTGHRTWDRLEETNCILCGKDMSICPYCQILHFSDILEDYPKLQQKFRETFSFHTFFS